MSGYAYNPEDCPGHHLGIYGPIMRCRSCGLEIPHHPSVEGAIAAARQALRDKPGPTLRPRLHAVDNTERTDDDPTTDR